VPTITSGLNKPRRPKNTKPQRKEITVSRIMRLAQIFLFWLPVKRKRVMVYIHDRKGFTCNPKYIVKKLVELYGDKLEIIWATMHPDTCQEIEKLGVKVVKSNTKKQMLMYLTTRFFITNDAFPSWALHRWGQKWMNTWHAGMNYKHIGYDYLMPMSPIAAKIFKIKNRQPDFFLSGSEFFTEDTSVSFRLKKKIFVPCGLPRNDAFFEDCAEVSKKVRDFYGIDADTKMAVFAPTFRVGMKSSTFGMDFGQICDALSKRFGGKWVLLFRNHNFVKSKQTYGGAIDVSGYHDMQELMCASDVLISDYSSCLYDFCMTKKPAFVYATDIDNYVQNERSFAYPFEKWPYPVAASSDELAEKIVSFDEEDYKAKVDAHLTDAGAYDDGTASEQVAKIVAKYCL
jgi:CDP-glycerol glycerophosphotransferase